MRSIIAQRLNGLKTHFNDRLDNVKTECCDQLESLTKEVNKVKTECCDKSESVNTDFTNDLVKVGEEINKDIEAAMNLLLAKQDEKFQELIDRHAEELAAKDEEYKLAKEEFKLAKEEMTATIKKLENEVILLKTNMKTLNEKHERMKDVLKMEERATLYH